MKTKYFACMCITYVPGSHRVQERASDTLQEQYDEDVRDYEEMSVIYHHEGFFWRCWFFGDDPQTSVWRYWFMNQPHPKRCIPGYLFPMQIAVGPFSHPSFDATAVYRGFWTIFIILGAASSLSGGFLLVYGVPFASAGCYKVGGGFLMISGSMGLQVHATIASCLWALGIQAQVLTLHHKYVLYPLNHLLSHGKLFFECLHDMNRLYLFIYAHICMYM
ncbi:transmembrane protein 182-like isoform X2 [Peromyscus maniculatus bairdii]|uniref:transmembrane protein 182-like isoform X2 n=1 Tax=Peromyscus maniculatus bairdii TaxID=230844 RepID=UPI003FD6A4FF